MDPEGGTGRDATTAPARLREARGAPMPPSTAAAEEGGSPRREERVTPPAPPPNASSGNPLANVTSSLRRAGTQVKRLGRKILAETSSVLPGGYQSKDRAESGDGSGPNDRRDEDVDGADGASPGRKTAPRHRPRYLDLGPLDPRQSFLSAPAFADSADPPEGYVNVWQGNFRRWQKRWLAATTPGVLTMHRRSSKIGPSVSVDLSLAAVLVAETTAGSDVSKTNKSGSSRQFLVVTPEKTYRIRALHARCRAPWVACIERSAERLERARALVRSRGKVSNVSSVAGGGSFGRSKPTDAGRSRASLDRAWERSSARKAGDKPRRPPTLDARILHRRAPSAEASRAKEKESRREPEPAPDPAAVRLALRERFLSADANPTLHASVERATRTASASARASADSQSAASSFVGVVGSFVRGAEREALETDATGASSSPSSSSSPRDVVAAVAEMRAAYDSTLAAVLERCARAEEQAARHRTRSAHLAAALAEFAGVVPSPGAAAGEAHVGFGRGERGAKQEAYSGDEAPLVAARDDGLGSTRNENRADVEIVTPGQSGFAAALRASGEKKASEDTSGDVFFVGPDGSGSGSRSGSGSDASDVSDEYGSVLSFATGVSGGSSFRNGSGSVANGPDDADDLDLLFAAELVNRHDFVISRSRETGADADAAFAGVGPPTSGKTDDSYDEADDDDDDDDSVVSSGTANASNSESEEESDDATRRAPRERLPAPQPLNQSFSIWDLLRKNMGKDLSRISMPANINQPLSLLQRTVEDFEHLHLLYEAIDCDAERCGTERVALLATFAASSYASWYGRAQKPFASTLGETYDWVSPDGLVRVVCECVVYDPPVAAFHARGVTPKGTPFAVHGEGMGASTFYGRYVQVNVKGGLHLELPRTREWYSWSKAAMHVHNVISGRVWVDMVGEVTVLAHPVFERDPETGSVAIKSGGERASFRLLKGSKPKPGRADARGRLEGSVFDRAGEKTASLVGNCLDAVWIERNEAYAGDAPVRDRQESARRSDAPKTAKDESDADGEDVSARAKNRDAKDPSPSEEDDERGAPAWRFGGVARDAARQYGFTPFAIALNELTPEGARNLPPTDSRFRPDMRALENGDSEEASRAKVRVEDRNRALAAARRKRGETYAPVWFAKRAMAEHSDSDAEELGNGAASPSSPGPSSPGSSQKAGANFAAARKSEAPPPFGKHVNTLENRTSLWAYKGAYWEQRERGEFEDPALVTDERFDVFGLAAAWRAERARRREKRAAKSETTSDRKDDDA